MYFSKQLVIKNLHRYSGLFCTLVIRLFWEKLEVAFCDFKIIHKKWNSHSSEWSKCTYGAKRNVSLELFKAKIEDADIKIVAITNHNTFDLEQYIDTDKGTYEIVKTIERGTPGKDYPFHSEVIEKGKLGDLAGK